MAHCDVPGAEQQEAAHAASHRELTREPAEQGERRRELRVGAAVACGAAAVVACIVFWAQADQSASATSRVELSLTSLQSTGKDNLNKDSFAEWYRKQSAATWFGDGTFHSKLVKGRERKVKNWLTKTDRAEIPAVLRAQADKTLKARMVQLSMSNLMSASKAHHLEEKVIQQLQEQEKQDGAWKPTTTQGDLADLPEAQVNSIISELEDKFMNRSVASYEAHVASEQPLSPAEQARQQRIAQERAAQEAATSKTMAEASPKLQASYQRVVSAKEEEQQKLHTLHTLLQAMYNTTGYVAADIGQCGQHCAEKLQAEAHARAAGEEGAQAEQRAQDRALRVEEGPPSLSGSQHAQADSGST